VFFNNVRNKKLFGLSSSFQTSLFLVTLFVAQQQIRPDIFTFFKDQQHKSSVFFLLHVTLHDVVDLLKLVGQPLLAAELVFVEGEDQA
jgi:hypothetical protein